MDVVRARILVSRGGCVVVLLNDGGSNATLTNIDLIDGSHDKTGCTWGRLQPVF
jgi:hypothetical protein